MSNKTYSFGVQMSDEWCKINEKMRNDLEEQRKKQMAILELEQQMKEYLKCSLRVSVLQERKGFL